MNPADIATLGPLADESGARAISLALRGGVRGQLIARIPGVTDRNAAEALRGLRLYAPRAALGRAGEGEWFVADLVGLAVETVDGRALGRVKAVMNFGAGDIVEVETPDGRTIVLPFSERVAQTVDVPGGRMVVDPPAEIEAKEGAA